MHRLAANMLIGACCGAAFLSSATAQDHEPQTSIEWGDSAQSILLECDSSPTDVCYFQIMLTNAAPPRTMSAAAGKSVKVVIGSQGASYCASAAPLDAKVGCSFELVTAGFHYQSAPAPRCLSCHGVDVRSTDQVNTFSPCFSTASNLSAMQLWHLAPASRVCTVDSLLFR